MKNNSPLQVVWVIAVALLSGPALAHGNLTAETNRAATSTFPLGEPVEVTFSVEGLEAGTKTELYLDVLNEFGKSVKKQEAITLSGDDDGNAQYVFSAPSSKLGYYEIKAKLSDGTSLSNLGTRPGGMITYAVVPDPLTRIDYGDTLSHFGLQGGFSNSALVIPYLGVRYILAGNDWGRMEPDHSGQFMQDRYKADHAGKRYPEKTAASEGPIYNGQAWNTYHISLVTNATLPAWAIKPNTSGTICKTFGALNETGETALPSFALALAKAFAADYKNQKSRYYQVTWEPGAGWCFGGTPEELVKIFKQSYEAIHQGDPHAIVAGPTLFALTDSTKALEGLWAAGLGKYIDALSIHPYVKEWPPETNGLADILRDQLKAAALAAGHPIPFIGTEHGFKSNVIGNLNEALGDIRSTLVILGEGAAIDFGFYIADFWNGDNIANPEGYGFYWNLNSRIKYGTNKLGPKIVVPAYAAMTYLLDGTTSKGELPNLSNTQRGYKFVRGKDTIEVVWDYAAQSSFPVPQGASVCDWMGNCSKEKMSATPINSAPTYIIIKQGS